MICKTACALILAAATWSPDRSQLRIEPSDRCAAQIRVYNHPSDSSVTGAVGALSLGNLEVGVDASIGLNLAPDTFTAFPPEGYIAIPPSVTLQEGESGIILICSADGVGA